MKNFITLIIISILLISCQNNDKFTPNKYSEEIPIKYKEDISSNYTVLLEINDFIKNTNVNTDTVLSNDNLFNLYCKETQICLEIKDNTQWSALIQPSYKKYHITFEYSMGDNMYYECTIDQNDSQPSCNTNTKIE
ncbi:hypothetical protein [Herpetosiphon llansteffanensis]|uniref:hypothetical protein n=1 Tax=Herpetosiphon llansteffanensis TaxID=2094568 RepID=UPI000D7BEBBD|nr:hypothetical protein [Herpetosiphon llansteffanensis]